MRTHVLVDQKPSTEAHNVSRAVRQGQRTGLTMVWLGAGGEQAGTGMVGLRKILGTLEEAGIT